MSALIALLCIIPAVVGRQLALICLPRYFILVAVDPKDILVFLWRPEGRMIKHSDLLPRQLSLVHTLVDGGLELEEVVVFFFLLFFFIEFIHVLLLSLLLPLPNNLLLLLTFTFLFSSSRGVGLSCRVVNQRLLVRLLSCLG